MKAALVTGANTGIGLAIAQRLLADGYALGYATAGEDNGPYDQLREQYGDDRVVWVHGDLADADVPAQLVSETIAATGRIDVLVNNAGVVTAKPFLDLTIDDFDLTFAVDVRAAFLLAQAAARQMSAGGSIVSITSVHEHIPRPGLAAYSAAKAALGMLSRSPARQAGGGRRARRLALLGRGGLRDRAELHHRRRADAAGRQDAGDIAAPAGQALNQRARRLDPKWCFSATRASDGSWKVPVGVGPERKSTSTRPTRPPPNSM